MVSKLRVVKVCLHAPEGSFEQELFYQQHGDGDSKIGCAHSHLSEGWPNVAHDGSGELTCTKVPSTGICIIEVCERYGYLYLQV